MLDYFQISNKQHILGGGTYQRETLITVMVFLIYVQSVLAAHFRGRGLSEACLKYGMDKNCLFFENFLLLVTCYRSLSKLELFTKNLALHLRCLTEFRIRLCLISQQLYLTQQFGFIKKCICSIEANSLLHEAYDIRDIHMLSLLLLFTVRNMETLIFSWHM